MRRDDVAGSGRRDSGTVDRSRAVGRVRVALAIGAAIWLALLVVGFLAPGGWVWGMPGPIGHIENFMISLWLVTLVLAPLLAARDPLARTPTIQVYLLGLLAIAASTIRGEPPEWISDAPPLIAAGLAAGLVIWAHPDRRKLFRP